MKVNQRLQEVITDISGNVLAIGIDNEKIINSLEKNDAICNCTLLDSVNQKGNDKSGYSKTVNIRHLRKKFKKKKTDYIVGNIKELEKFLKYFIKDSIFISSNTIYLYGKLEQDKLEELIKKYKRYNVKIDVIENKNNFLLTIDTKNAKTNRFKDLCYFVIDTIADLLTTFSDILVN